MNCAACGAGLVLPVDSLQADSVWRCGGCGADTQPDTVTELEDAVEAELEVRNSLGFCKTFT